MTSELIRIKIRAVTELREEQFARDVAAEKVRILIRRERSLWDRLFPFSITITRKHP